jgi:hypothetical protein
MSCINALYQCIESMQCINVMHQYHATTPCINYMHQYHAPTPCINACINTMHHLHASVPGIDVRAPVPSISRILFQRLATYMPCITPCPEPSYCRSLYLCLMFLSPLKGQCHEMDISWRSKHCIQYFLCTRYWFSRSFKRFPLPYKIISTFYLVLWIHLLLLRPSSEYLLT